MDFCLSYVTMIVCVCEEHSGSRVCLIDSLLKYTGQIKKNIVNIGHVEFVWINRTNPIIYTWIKCSFAGQQQHLSTNRTPDSGPVPTVLPTVCSVWGSGVEWCPLRCPASGSTISNSSFTLQEPTGLLPWPRWRCQHLGLRPGGRDSSVCTFLSHVRVCAPQNVSSLLVSIS